MCQKCNKNSCTGCAGTNSGSNNAQYDAILSELQDQINGLIENTKIFSCGHPMMMIQDANDIASFDANGKGFGCFEKWAVCNGNSHINPITKKAFATPNLIDRFPVQAGGIYEVADVGGENSHTLTVSELPSHNHGVMDPGHIHSINDPGHIHPIQDDMHTHQSVSAPHRHDLDIDSVGDHSHTYTANDAAGDDYNIGITTPPYQATIGNNENNTGLAGGHTHSGITEFETVQITNDPAATGIEVLESETGIDNTESATTGVTTINQGGDQPHENRPPYYACLFIIKYY